MQENINIFYFFSCTYTYLTQSIPHAYLVIQLLLCYLCHVFMLRDWSKIYIVY